MIIHSEGQGSVGWETRRAGMVTASGLGNLLTDKFAIRKGQMVESYLAEKIAEKWLQGPLPNNFQSFAMFQGEILESEALPFLEFELGITIERTGLITTDDMSFGASPDGVAKAFGVEIKCPMPQTQVRYLLGECVPEEYMLQVQGGMLATGFDSWRFLSYRRGMPKLLLTVERDETIIASIREAVDAFNVRLADGYRKLVELNDGNEPQKREPMVFSMDIQNQNEPKDDQH